MTSTSASSLRLVFMGTAGFAVPSLEALAAGPHRLIAVYTQPARPAGRGLRARPSPVESAAARLGLPVRRPESLRAAEAQAEFGALGAEVAVVAAYGLILPRAVLAAPRLGCINLHASLLPRWRGAAPIQRALLAGDAETGITIFQIEPALDSGPILASESIPIAPASTAQSLHDELAALAARMIGPVVDDLAAGRARPQPQPEAGVTYAAKVDKAEGRLDWTRPAAVLERQVRALEPWPGCWTELGGQRLRVLAAEVAAGRGMPGEVLDERLTVACGEDALRLLRVQPADGRAMASAAFLRGHRRADRQPARPLMARYKLTLEYDGGPFQGWQRQGDGASVQASLEAAVLAFCGEQVQVVGAGRTDAGVHACGQVAHLDLAREVSVETLRDALNHHLRPAPVVVLEAAAVDAEFHARFSAQMRHYRYRIVNRRPPLALDRGRAWQVPGRLDAEIMHEAAQRLVGRHDFTSFRSALCQAQSPVKTLAQLTVVRRGAQIEISARARSFLHHQVRNMVGTLKLIGEARWPVERIETALAAQDRAAAGPTAPACGLYLIRVDY